jgi:hypothetical protein
MSNQAELPPGFGFIWSVDDLETNYPDRIEPRYNTMSTTSIANDRVKPYWLPPNHRDHYKIKREGNLYRWDTEGSKRVPQFSRKTLSLYSTASVFIQARQDNFLVIDQDCRERDVVELDCGWSQLGFNHHMSSGLSEARFYGRDHPYLAAPANGSTWMPQVVPATYNRPIAGPRRCEVLPPLTGGLCGRLAIILALVAFSADVASVERVIANGFRLGRWLEQDVPVGIGSRLLTQIAQFFRCSC